jgi:hypothetical protein
MPWNEVIGKITPVIVKIETPEGHGTGFLCLYNESRSICGFATALHVVSHADQWQEPIRIIHPNSENPLFLKEDNRVIWVDKKLDSAVILTQTGQLNLPKDIVPLLPTDHLLPIGAEVGWLGYPAIGPHTLCFFSGSISAFQEADHAYLIDGVAINGVSGGPVIYSTAADGIQIVGTISAYMANRATGGALPGLSVAQDVSHFHAIASRIRSLDEANRKKQEQKAAADEPKA